MRDFKHRSVTVPTSLVDIHPGIHTRRLARIATEIVLTTQTFDQFQIMVKFHKDGAWVVLYSATGDFTSPAGLLVGASGDLTALAPGIGWFIMDVTGIYKVKLQAACAVAGGISVVRGGGE